MYQHEEDPINNVNISHSHTYKPLVHERMPTLFVQRYFKSIYSPCLCKILQLTTKPSTWNIGLGKYI